MNMDSWKLSLRSLSMGRCEIFDHRTILVSQDVDVSCMIRVA